MAVVNKEVVKSGNAFRDAVEKHSMNMTTTWNGALANASTHSACLDLFAQMGNYLTLSDSEFEQYFRAAWNEDKLVALRLLFFNRDVRGGQKVKKFLQYILSTYTNNNDAFSEWLANNINLIPEFGYWKDLYSLYGTVLWSKAVKYWCDTIKRDNLILNGTYPASKQLVPGQISLAAKFAPSESQKASWENNEYKKEFLKHFDSPKQYRLITTALRTKLNLVEKIMSANQWNEIQYDHVPSVAFMNYRKAFAKHDTTRFNAFIADDKTTVHAGVLTPVTVYSQYKNAQNEQADIEKIWKNLDDVFGSMRDDVRILTVADCSASMSSGVGSVPPIDAAHAMTIYCAERNKGVFHNMYMTFSRTAKFYTLSDKSLFRNIQDLRKHGEVANTNVQSVFDEILRVAVQNNVPQSDMPTTVLLLSDMQFDSCVEGLNNKRNLDAAQQKFENAGYACPTIIFWNLNSAKNFAGTKHDTGAILVSGYSEQMLKFVINAEPGMTPLDTMLEVVNNPRYSIIKI